MMQQLTPQAQKELHELAQRYHVSIEAVTTLLYALVKGNGTMAQFNIQELGGTGQWMRGGMVMVGDMFNNSLKAKVEGLCSDLSALLATPLLQPLSSRGATPSRGVQYQQQESSRQTEQGGTHPPVSASLVFQGSDSGSWWPEGLGTPTTTGAQNSIRYAYFPQTRRLAVEVNGKMTLYDTRDHQISGVSQQQGAESSLTFTSQHGVVPVATLPVVARSPQENQEERKMSPQNSPPSSEAPQPADILATIERLAELKQKGILSDEEFSAKKAELLRKL
jgi:hypothetical protein